MVKYVCDICGKEAESNDFYEGFMRMGEMQTLPYIDIDVCETCKHKIKENRDIVVKTICKSIKKELKRV